MADRQSELDALVERAAEIAGLDPSVVQLAAEGLRVPELLEDRDGLRRVLVVVEADGVRLATGQYREGWVAAIQNVRRLAAVSNIDKEGDADGGE